MKRIALTMLASSLLCMPAVFADDDEHSGSWGSLAVSPGALTFNAPVNGALPAAQTLTVSASRRTGFTASASVQTGGRNWLAISPSGSLTTNQSIKVTVNQTGLTAGTYSGRISLATRYNTTRVAVTLVVAASGGSGGGLTVSPGSLSFSAPLNGAAPATQSLSVTAASSTNFAASASGQASGRTWLSISPSGNLTTNRTLTVSVNQAGLAAGNFTGSISLVSGGATRTVPVTLAVSSSGGGGGGVPNSASFKLIGWNDLGMHCLDGKDYSVFAVLPPYNTIHAHLLDSTGKLITAAGTYTVTYQAVTDPLTNTINTTSIGKTNFWQYAAALGFGALAADTGLKGFAMPGAQNTPRAMQFSAADNTWLAEGIPIMPLADSPNGQYQKNTFPMMRLIAKNASGTVLATTDIVLPTSDEMTCSVCHASNATRADARPAAGWVNHSDPAKDIKLNILRKHDDRVKGIGLEATATGGKPILCASCHATNALGAPGVAGIPALTTAMHGTHTGVIDPATNATLGSSTSRTSCYLCHPGPNTKCLRGAMGDLKTASGGFAMECQSCHGGMSTVAVATRKGWLEEPACQSCHTGTATQNSGQIVYTSVFSSGTTVRAAANQTFATNANTPAAGLSMYRFSKGHGGLQCEGCHGSTHAEFPTPVVNDNVQSNNLQGHAGTLAECTACHSSMPSTVTGGPHGLHPIGTTWVSSHRNVAEGGGATACQACHGTDYRGTVLSRMQADRTMAGRSFPRGTVIGCYSCHNGPSGD